MERPKKVDNLLEVIRQHLEFGEYRFTVHAEQRCLERNVNDLEVIHVLRTGWHEKRKDSYDEVYSAWNYAVRGASIDEDRELRIVISFDEGMVIITVIDVSR